MTLDSEQIAQLTDPDVDAITARADEDHDKQIIIQKGAS